MGAILLFIKQITEAFGVDLSAQIEQVSGLIGAIITFLVGIGVVTDPTTVGVKDSGITSKFVFISDTKIKGHLANTQGGNEGAALLKVISH